uniref:Protein phosphatase 1 regulatory subunit 37 n=1 Tax=Fundulus heteroclitus TaxID=8078 RepID=A0A3Q2QDT6_FUNHE
KKKQAQLTPPGAGDTASATEAEASAADPAGLYPLVEEGEEKQRQSGKRVTFPSDEDIVSGAVEPKDPWRHALNVTVEEIISSYKEACQKLNCKPIPKVLKQIQELKDLTQRNECLDLKGEKLDYKTCESLEEILKRVQFKVIDLEQTNLDEDTDLCVCLYIHLAVPLLWFPPQTSSLQYLDARNTPLLDHSAPFVARALRISGSLAVLHLENAGLSGRPLMLLATALKMNMNLRELYLADNKLNGLQDSAQLGNLLKFNYNIQILDLRNNHILDSGLAYLCEGLKEQRKGLVTLVLWNNQLTHNGMGHLAGALPCTQSLETLNLGHNSVGNEGVHKLKDGLIANRSVLRLGLASTKLSCEGAVAVAEFIAESPRLLRLDLRENEIKTGGLMALSLALKVNNSLLRLDLDREPKKESVKSFIDTQRGLLTEIQNGCKRNFILAKEKEETEEKMRLSASMAEIATEDGTREEEEEEPASAETKGGEEESETAKNKTQAGSQAETSTETTVPPINLDSDSDTEDEDEAEVVTKSSSVVSNQTAPPTQTGVSQPPLRASCTPSPPSVSPVRGPGVISGITVTETTVSVTPPSPGRCISVSSPGRGHKIFMVTRVESPPEQLQKIAPAAPCPSKDLTTQQTQPPPASQAPTHTQLTPEGTKGSPPAPSADSKMTEETHRVRLEPETDAAQSHKPDPPSPGQPADEAKARTLDPAGAVDPSPQTPALPSSSSSEQDVTLKPTSSSERPQPEPTSAEGSNKGEEDVTDGEQGPSPNELIQPQASTQEQLNTDEAAETEATPPPSQTQEEPSQEEASLDPHHSVQTDQPEPPASAQPEDAAAVDPDSQVRDQDSTDESSADESFVVALDGEVVGSTLPNGLKPEFSLHLLDGESPKPGSCVMEHGESQLPFRSSPAGLFYSLENVCSVSPV